MILDDAQIEAQMQELINATWPPNRREKAMRTGLLLTELNTFFAEMSAVKAQKIADRDNVKAIQEAEIAMNQSTILVQEI